MITRTSKASPSTLGQVADIVLDSASSLRGSFPHASDREKLVFQLARSREPWSILSIEDPIALFRLQLLGTVAVLDKFLPSQALPLDTIILALKRDLAKMRVESVVLQVPDAMTEGLGDIGFDKLRTLVRLAGRVVETKRMPILPLNSPSEKDVPVLAKLMRESYEKSLDGKLSLLSVQNNLRDIMTGIRGPYVMEASLMSGTTQNPVSACLVTLNSPEEAEVAQLFTHPLYRARGLATTEVAASMNKLTKRGVQRLTVLVNESNDVAMRLFTKLEFSHNGRLVEMRANTS